MSSSVIDGNSMSYSGIDDNGLLSNRIDNYGLSSSGIDYNGMSSSGIDDCGPSCPDDVLIHIFRQYNSPISDLLSLIAAILEKFQ